MHSLSLCSITVTGSPASLADPWPMIQSYDCMLVAVRHRGRNLMFGASAHPEIHREPLRNDVKLVDPAYSGVLPSPN